MEDDRLPTGVWVQAVLAQCSAAAIPAVVRRRGDPHTGVLIARIDRLDGGNLLLTQQRDVEGVLRWVDALTDPNPDGAAVEAYIDRAVARDPDLWVIEVEDREGRNPFETG
jgi:hypothetical protein